MKKIEQGNNLKKMCSFICEHARAVDKKVSCMTFNSIDCKKYNVRMDKGRPCYEYLK